MNTSQKMPRCVSAHELDEMCRVPRALRLRTFQVLGLLAAVASLGAALEWPHAWRMIAILAIAALSVLFAMAAAREWRLIAVRGPAFGRQASGITQASAISRQVSGA